MNVTRDAKACGHQPAARPISAKAHTCAARLRTQPAAHFSTRLQSGSVELPVGAAATRPDLDLLRPASSAGVVRSKVSGLDDFAGEFNLVHPPAWRPVADRLSPTACGNSAWPGSCWRSWKRRPVCPLARSRPISSNPTRGLNWRSIRRPPKRRSRRYRPAGALRATYREHPVLETTEARNP